MQFQTTILFTLIASAFALPTPPVRRLPLPLRTRNTKKEVDNSKQKRNLVTLDLDPSVDVNLLNDLCIGIAVCNPVTVNSNNGA